ncbi:MAG: NAD(P)/FAD-dependent oxidoreductase, partial [Frankiaceae bacterium]
MTHPRPHILIVGGGYVGLYTALRLQRKLRDGEATVTVVEPHSYMTYEPFLPECAAGSLEPRHVVVPLRRVLRKCRIVSGWVRRLSHERRLAHVEPLEGPAFDLAYDILVMCPGSISRTLPIPGLQEIGVGVKSVGEATYLRNQVISQMDAAASTDDEAIRRRALTFLFVGAGYAGIETFAELADMASDACKWYPSIQSPDMRWVMVEASDHILPEVSSSLSLYTLEQLRHRGMEIHLSTRLTSIVDGRAVLDNGIEFDTDTVAWTAGVRAHPLIENATDLPVDDKHRLKATAFLQVDGVEDAWTAGDCAAVPDLA